MEYIKNLFGGKMMKEEVAAVNTEPFVNDLRPAGSPSFNNIPRLNTWAEMTSWLGISIDDSKGWAAAPVGSLVWKVVGFNIKDGPAEFRPLFLGESGAPVSGIIVVHSWPGAPSLPPAAIVPDYSGGHGVAGTTNNSGEVGFGYSGGMVYTGSKPYKGIGIIWPLVPQHLPEPKFADCATGLGWVGGTDHTTPSPVFRLVRKGSEPDPTPIGTKFSLALHQDGQDLGVRIAFIEQSVGVGWELVLLDEAGQVMGSSKFN